MILDDSQVLLEGLPVQANATAISTRFDLPARFDLNFYFVVEDTVNQSVTFELQQSDTEKGTYTDVDGTEFTLSGDALKAGKGVAPYKILPPGVTKTWIKLKITSTTAPTAGKVICALTREVDEPYTTGQYINKGEVDG